MDLSGSSAGAGRTTSGVLIPEAEYGMSTSDQRCPNVLLIMSDQHHAGVLGAAGDGVAAGTIVSYKANGLMRSSRVSKALVSSASHKCLLVLGIIRPLLLGLNTIEHDRVAAPAPLSVAAATNRRSTAKTWSMFLHGDIHSFFRYCLRRRSCWGVGRLHSRV